MALNNFTIYKIDNSQLITSDENEILSIIRNNLKDEFNIPEGTLNFNNISIGIKNYTFLGTRQYDNDFPIWFNFLDLVGYGDQINELQESFLKIKSSILSVFKIGNNYYIITFGNGFHSLPNSILDENFGINLAKKFITDEGKVNGIFQSVIQGDLDSTYKSIKSNGTYNAMGDISNLNKKLKTLKGVGNSNIIFNDIEELQGLHLSLDGKKGLKLDIGGIQGGGLDSTIFNKILIKIQYFDNREFPNSYKIPDLIKIDNNNDIYNSIIGEIKNNFLDNHNNIYFSADLLYLYIFGEKFSGNTINSFRISDGETNLIFNKDEYGLIENLDFINFLINGNINFNNLENIKINSLKYINDDGIEESSRKNPKIIQFLKGEINYEEDLYFFEGDSFFKPNQDFLDLVFSNFEEKIENFTLNDNNFLHNWNIANSVTSGGRYDEEKFNKAHDKNIETTLGKEGYYCLDKGVNMNFGMDGIEICDLLKYIEGGELYFIHVKRTHGANIRVLLSQGKVGTMKILENFTETARHIRNKTSLNINSTKIERKNFTIVYAIKNSGTTNIFTPYAKYDFISTLEYFHNKGLNKVKFYEIN